MLLPCGNPHIGADKEKCLSPFLNDVGKLVLNNADYSG